MGSMNYIYKKEERFGNEQLKGLVATILFVFLMMLALFFFGLYYQEPPPEEQGVMMALGEPDAGMNSEPEANPETTSSTPPLAAEPQEDETLTQDEEEAPAVEREKNKTEKTKPVETIKKEPTPPKEETKPEERKADPSSLFQKREKKGEGQGEGEKKGNQGDENGDQNGKPGGSGLGTEGVRYSLGGRGIARGVNVTEKPQREGVVVMQIWVDKQGNVIRAKFQLKGSTTQDADLIRIAERSALTAKFQANSEAPDEQVGTITFTFKLR